MATDVHEQQRARQAWEADTRRRCESLISSIYVQLATSRAVPADQDSASHYEGLVREAFTAGGALASKMWGVEINQSAPAPPKEAAGSAPLYGETE